MPTSLPTFVAFGATSLVLIFGILSFIMESCKFYKNIHTFDVKNASIPHIHDTDIHVNKSFI